MTKTGSGPASDPSQGAPVDDALVALAASLYAFR